jgi:hypothetical protein
MKICLNYLAWQKYKLMELSFIIKMSPYLKILNKLSSNLFKFVKET